ncbi:MAG TPA: 23S rRNA (guanosine(2251)-2'-O)-methyltransferase RlmB [Mycobacteriales bacterium]|nr:23S rRNA (guanosine(2251)-2'-O)-methyltransferase RlmB [Mycobacteriales bacterium]
MAPGKGIGRGGKPAKKAPKPTIARGGQGGRAGKAGSSRKGSPIGSGGQGKDKLKGRGPTPPAEERTGHPAARKAAAATRRAASPGAPRGASGGTRGAAAGGGPRRTAVGIPSRRSSSSDSAPRRPHTRSKRPGEELEEVVVGRNPVVEALRAGVPGRGLLVARGIDHDARVTEALELAEDAGVPTREAVKAELDRLAEGSLHQGLALQVSAYDYAHPEDLLHRAMEHAEPVLLVALDGVTDPRNLGAILRSASAFGAHGLLVPERRAAGVTAAAWRTSAGAAAHIPVARAVNLARALKAYADAGVTVVGLAAGGDLTLDDLEVAVGPICLVVGSEGKGLGRLVGDTCDLLVSIPMAGHTESLNASVAASVALAEVARRRRSADRSVGA